MADIRFIPCLKKQRNVASPGFQTEKRCIIGGNGSEGYHEAKSCQREEYISWNNLQIW